MMDLTVLDQLIVGRVDPHIYAFTTNTIPNFLKVGDTYRPVAVRLQEWREHFPDLQKEYESVAKVSDDTYFRDFAVHSFLEQERHRARLQPADLLHGVHYSKEFFKEATVQDVTDAITDIRQDFEKGTNKYQYYNAETRLPETYTYERTETYPTRPNQDKTIQQFMAAKDAGRTNLLMYAVMRFGKSFTSMCCATKMGARIVTVVSAKADVREEWKKTVESHVRFVDYRFLTGDDLNLNENVIKETLASGKRVVVFLTLQDLQGETIKEKHKELFGQKIDLLIVDETHFGARAEKYGQVLRAAGYEKDVKNKKDAEDYIEATDADEQIKILDARIRLHLSGTPYRILMGSEFAKEDIIAFYQFTDIVKDQEKWIRENNVADEPQEEWENPYYGFPQMIRFAFHPNESSRQRLKELRKSGITYAFSALLKPQSVKKADDGSHKRFVYENEILDLLAVIDGSKEDDTLLGFLDYDKIKSGNMCRHIVCVLPYCASCDAMEVLIRNNADKFKNLNDYEIINISGVDQPNAYNSSSAVKRKIRDCEEAGKKTLTLTVNRMLTGSTVEQWDTMLFLKDTASPQEYDQAIFRLQNQYIKKFVDDSGSVIKYNMKPQTLLVDFDPNRMFSMQEQKSQIYNVNVDEAGNSRLEERIREELRVSPIVVVNHDRMERVRAADILQAVSEYSKTRGVAEETAEIPVDLSLMKLDTIRVAIERENELGSKAGFTTAAHSGDGDGSDMGIPGSDSGDAQGPEQNDDQNGANQAADTSDSENKNDPVKQFRSYYARMLFFAFLTKDTVISLEDIIDKMESPDNARIARNIGITKPVLKAIQENINKFILRDLDYKIHNLNRLSHDDSVDPIKRASVAVRKFGKLGESEVITPKNICDEMVAQIPDEGLKGAIQSGHKILDIAGKAGEFALAVYDRLTTLGCEPDAIKDAIYTIPTSGITYEFTRKVYEILELNVANLAERFNSYDLLTVKDANQKVDYQKISKLLTQPKPFNLITMQDTVVQGDEDVKFDVIVGNPPYQVSDGGAQASARPIYNIFVTASKTMEPEYMTIIMPTRWYAGGKGLDLFRDQMLSDENIELLHDYLTPEYVFPNTNIRGGICYFLWNKDFNNKEDLVHIITHVKDSVISDVKRPLKINDSEVFIRHNQAISVLEKVKSIDSETLESWISPRRPFGIGSAFSSSSYFKTDRNDEYSIKCIGKGHKIGYIRRSDVMSHEEWIDCWKVFMPRANNVGTELNDDNLNAFAESPGTVCTESYIAVGIGKLMGENDTKNLANYMKTRFARFMHSLAKASQDATAKTFVFVPVQDFSRPWTDAELYAKYGLADEEIAFIEATIKPME